MPTLVFPHTYFDDEEAEIKGMVLSHARRGKHLVFDGRLLHGAPSHPSLLQRGGTGETDRDEDATEVPSSLRVTFLVNIWRSGRPAGVDVLPGEIREEIRQSAATFNSAVPLEFRPRSLARLPVNAYGEDVTIPAGDRAITLPFVSEGATWIGGEEDKDDRTGEETKSSGVHEIIEDRSTNNPADGTNDAVGKAIEGDSKEEGEEDGGLVLALPPFDTSEYLEEEADTIILSFENGNTARLVRVGVEEESERNDERNVAAALFLSYLQERVPPFITTMVAELKHQCGVDVSGLQADHVCYRTDSLEKYTSLVDALQSSDDFALLVESKIGGRPIATFKLATPLVIESVDGSRKIDVVEIPAPKDGSPYNAGLEHAEFVIGEGTHESPLRDEVHTSLLNSWMERHPEVSWSAKAIGKACNPDVSTKLELDRYGKVSVKFHLMPLESVIEFENRSARVKKSARGFKS